MVFSTYIGDEAQEYATDIAIDPLGNIYITGFIDYESLGYDWSKRDVLVVKLSADGSRVLYRRVFGGSDWDGASSIAVDASGNAYIAGTTVSRDFPILNSLHERRRDGHHTDAFVVKLDAQGETVFATYLGGTAADVAGPIALDRQGFIYVAGGFSPGTPGLIQRVYSSRVPAVVKLRGDGQEVVFTRMLLVDDHEFFQGNDDIRGLAIDADGSIHLAGYSWNGGLVMVNPIQGEIAGQSDVFVMKLDPTGKQILFSTYLGGMIRDEAYDLALDKSGNIYITGLTNVVGFEVKEGFTSQLGATRCMSCAFVAKIDPGRSRLSWAVRFGGSEQRETIASSIAVDAFGAAYVTGYTDSDTFPRKRPLSRSFWGILDQFLVKLHPSGKEFQYASYLGAEGPDFATGLALDAERNIYLAGSARFNYPLVSPHQDTWMGELDLVAVKLEAVDHILYFPHFAAGSSGSAEIGSELTIVNLDDRAWNRIQLKIRDEEGRLLPLEINGKNTDGTFEVSIPPLGTTTITTATGGPLTAGSATVYSILPATGSLSFVSSEGRAAVLSGEATSEFNSPVVYDGQTLTGLAMMAIRDGQLIELELFDSTGRKVSSAVLSLDAWQQQARFIDQLDWNPKPSFNGFRGTIKARSSGRLAALALLAGSRQLATLPVNSK